MFGHRDPGSDKSEASSEATEYHSFASSSTASTSTTDYLSFTTSTPTESTSFTTATATSHSEQKSDTGKKSDSLEESTAEELSEYDEKTDEFLGAPPPFQNFPGKLASGEKWLMCPYDNAHFYICTRSATHLFTCRAKYLAERKMEDKNADIVICRFDSMHHGPKAKLKNHEMNCEKGSMYFIYLDHFIERQRYSNYVAKKEAEKKGEAEGMEGVDAADDDDDKKKKMEGGKDDKVDYHEDKEDTPHDDSDDNQKDDDLDFF